MNRLLPVLLSGVIAAGCGNSSSPPTDARVPDTGGGRDGTTPDTAPRDTATDAPAETNRAVVATPVFAPAGGVYADPQSVTITSSAGAQIHYTLDGSEPTAASPLYAAPLAVSTTTTIKAIAVDPTGASSNSAVGSATYTLSARVPPPAFSLPAGTYGSPQLVTVTDSNVNATIRYTVDGSEPNATSTVYTMPITVSATMTIKAIASLTGMVDSLVSSALYTIQTLAPAATPTFTPAAGTYAGARDVTIASATPAAEIYYTLDGTDPTQASTLYAAPVHVANSMVVKARAYATGMAPSAIASAAYSITAPAAAAPTISPNGGTFTAPQQVTLSTTETGGRIIYTTDGSIPNTTTGTIYTAPFTLAQTATVNAIVVNVTGKDPSPVASAVFTINIALPIAFDKQAGTYNNDVSVAITSSTSGATVCYTKDASDPACNATGGCASGQSTAGVPVVISGNANAAGTTVRARACKAGLPAGPVVEQIYTMVAAAVVFSPAGSTVAIGTAVSMSSTTSGAEIRYRDDSTDPTCTTGTVYTAAVTLSQSKQFRAIACKANYNASAVSNASYGVKLTTPIALQLDSGNQYFEVAATATTANRIDDLVFALGLGTTAVTGQTLCTSVNGTAPACTTAGACNTNVAGLFSRTLQVTADPLHGRLSNVVGDSANGTSIAAPTDGSATLTVRAAFCAPNYAISDVSTVTYTFKAATPTLSRATGTTTLATENANDIIATTTTGARLRYSKVASGATAPTLSCTGAVPTGVTEVNAITTTIQVNGGDTVSAIACRTNYNPSDTVTANYPLPGTTVAPVFSTQGTTTFNNDITAGLIKITDTDIPNVGDTVLQPAGVVCWTTADSGTVNCNEHATAPTCVTPPSPGGTYSWNSAVSPAVSNLPAIAGTGVRLRAIACAPGKAKSAITSQTFAFQVADPTITPPAQATSTAIGIGEVLTFTSTTAGATMHYTKGTSGSPPANPTCNTVTTGSSYTVLAADATNGSLIIRVIACKNQYTASAVVTSNTYTSFRGAAPVFGIPAGTYGDVFEASSSNTPSGLQSVSVANATGLARICVTKNGVIPTCTNDNHCGVQGGGPITDVLGGVDGIANGIVDGTIAWSFFNTSGLTLRAQACYSNRAEPPLVVSGPYNFQVAPLTITNTTPNPGTSPFSKTQRLVFRVGNEASTGVDAVKAPSATTATGPVRLCTTTDGSALGTGCSSAGSMTCVDMTPATASATHTVYVDSTKAFAAKACKSTMTPSTANSTVTITPYARTLSMSGANDFVGHEAAERFATSTTTTHFFTSWDATYLYLGWQGCGLNPSTTADGANFTLAYLGVPGRPGATIGTAFTVDTDRAARWQIKYLVGSDTPQIRIRNFSGSGSWDTVPNAGLTSIHGAGNTAACATAGDNTGDYVIVRVPLLTLANPGQIAIAEGINLGVASSDSADAAGWPFTAADAVFDAPAALFDLAVWQPPTGATGCLTSGIDGRAECQVAPAAH